MERLTEKDNAGNKLLLKNAVECVSGDLKHWSISTSTTGTQTIRGYAVDKLAEYEDLEEQGKLLRMPCAIGDVVYIIPSKVNYRLNILDGHKENNRVYRQIVGKIVCTKNGYYMESVVDLEYGTGRIIVDKLYKETWFFTESEAELALKEMEGEK